MNIHEIAEPGVFLRTSGRLSFSFPCEKHTRIAGPNIARCLINLTTPTFLVTSVESDARSLCAVAFISWTRSALMTHACGSASIREDLFM